MRGILIEKEETLFESPNTASLIRTTVYRSSGEKESVCSVSYDEQGKIQSEKTVLYDEDGVELTTDVRLCMYDEQGMQIGQIVTRTDTRGVRLSLYRVAYLAPGVKDFEQTIQYDEDGDPKTEYTVLYEETQKKTFENVYQKDGSYTATVRTYDLNGVLQTAYTVKCDKDGNVID